VDVRAFPVSRRHPQFSRDALSESIAGSGLAYHWQGKALGGFRKSGYEEHMKTPLFGAAAAALIAHPGRVCIMCAETKPEECHRWHISNWLVSQGSPVVHLINEGEAREHRPDPQPGLF
jgi:uncharacterized protein (DUF488 family)